MSTAHARFLAVRECGFVFRYARQANMEILALKQVQLFFCPTHTCVGGRRTKDRTFVQTARLDSVLSLRATGAQGVLSRTPCESTRLRGKELRSILPHRLRKRSRRVHRVNSGEPLCFCECKAILYSNALSYCKNKLCVLNPQRQRATAHSVVALYR